MPRLVWFFALLLSGVVSYGSSSGETLEIEPQSIQQFCQSARRKEFFKQRLALRASRIAFHNHGGLVNGGVCWWHSRYQRKATYLTVMRPDLPKPSYATAKKLVAAIKKSQSLVEIPGYATFQEFSHAYESEVLRVLEGWQINEGFFQFAWVAGLTGASSPGATKMERLLEMIRIQVQDRNRIGFVHLQIPGITNHAWLVSRIERSLEGWDLEIVDSNFPSETRSLRYVTGEKAIYDPSLRQWIAPYLAERDEIKTLENVVQRECKHFESRRTYFTSKR